MTTASEKLFIDFKNLPNSTDWRIINDTVMGGKSKAVFYLNKENNGVFEGTVSTENNGGFSFLRHRFKKLSISKFSKVLILVKGDGKRYQFRMKSNKNDQYSYITYFKTTNKWQLITISLTDLIPIYRGRKLKMSNYEGEKVEEIGFLIGNKKNEPFQLLIDTIKFN